MSRLNTLSARLIGVDPGPGITKIFNAGLVFRWNGEEVCVRFTTSTDGTQVPAERRGTDGRVARTGSNLNTLTLTGNIVTRLGVTLTVVSGEVTQV